MNLNEFFLIILTSALVNNFVLVQFLGVNPFFSASKKSDSAMSFASAMIFLMTLTSIISFAIDYCLLAPFGLGYLRTLAFVLVIIMAAQIVKIVIEKTNPNLYRSVSNLFPLIAVNSAVLGVALMNAEKSHNFFESTLYAIGSALGFGLVFILFSAMRERLVAADVPAPFKGAAIEMIALGFVSLAFMGFSGLGN